MTEFNSIVQSLIEKPDFESKIQPVIIQITETHLGKGKKVSQCNRNQVEAIQLIVNDLKDMLKTS